MLSLVIVVDVVLSVVEVMYFVVVVCVQEWRKAQEL